VSSRNGDKARLNKQQRRRRVRRAELSAAHKLALKNKKAINLEPERSNPTQFLGISNL
jgi:hypothetical protein